MYDQQTIDATNEWYDSIGHTMTERENEEQFRAYWNWLEEIDAIRTTKPYDLVARTYRLAA